MKHEEEKKVGVEVREVYDGILFWWYPETNSYRARFPLEWYKESGIDLLSQMESFAASEENEASGK